MHLPNHTYLQVTEPIHCNDTHSKLNPTDVSEIIVPQNESDVVEAIIRAKNEGKQISICGSRHSMGGQQFGKGTFLLDMRSLDSVGSLDLQSGIVKVGAGICWPALIEALLARQKGNKSVWTIRQKQTGADRLTLGGALASNIHGRGLHMKPFIDDVESFRLIDSKGITHCCSREQNSKLFSLAIGGYGCFGVVTQVSLRLSLRTQLERIVEVTTLDLLPSAVSERISKGCLYGDFQFSIDETSEDFLWKGVLSSYRPVGEDSAIPETNESLGVLRWEKLVHMAHFDRQNVFSTYSDYYLSTHGNRYWSDTHQLGVYVDGYHEKLDRECQASEMITELYVPHEALISFMKNAASLLRESGLPVIYGTMRLIRKDSESYLPWAKQDFACVIFNLHLEHTDAGIALAQQTFRALIVLALEHSGSYFLTYHRWAEKAQVEAAYPNFQDFLKEKIAYDPSQQFQSEWWRHYQKMFGIPEPETEERNLTANERQ